MAIVSLKRSALLGMLLSFLFMIGCSGLEFAPKKSVWYYPPELVKMDKAVKKAKMSGKDKKCPVEFHAVHEMNENTYDIYLACRTDEAIALAKDIKKEAKALCPSKKKRGHIEPEVIAKMTFMVNFDFDKSAIRGADINELKRATAFVKKYPGTRIEIEGHTDNTGSVRYNKMLSDKRASAVKQYLVSKGRIDSKRITTIGYSELKPVATNKTKQGRAQNRRVEILILKG